MRSFLEASWGLQSREREGQLQELTTTYAFTAADAMHRLVTLVVGLFTLVALVISALALDIAAAIAAAAAVAALTVATRPIRQAVRRRAEVVAQSDLRFATVVAETATTAQEVRIFDVTNQVRHRIERRVDDHRHAFFRMQLVSGALPGLPQGLALLLVVAALAIVYGAGLSELSVIGAVVLIMLRCLSYGQGLQTSYQLLHEDAPHLERLLDQQRTYRRSATRGGDESLGAIDEITFDDVEFAYEPGRPVLRGISFRLERGDVTGLIGPSGAGKSTLVQLLLRLREPTSGRILVDGGTSSSCPSTAGTTASPSSLKKAVCSTGPLPTTSGSFVTWTTRRLNGPRSSFACTTRSSRCPVHTRLPWDREVASSR
ncbi:MAG: ABC transporter ATP-binding protein/permease [Actinomycetota bacterium]|nr:ABC transporter ATP-binding protein/permease [Actinomycetota bacterium]